MSDDNDPVCELCDEPADFRNAPFQVNNSFRFGPLCERCYIPAEVLKYSFREEAPAQELEDYDELGGPEPIER